MNENSWHIKKIRSGVKMPGLFLFGGRDGRDGRNKKDIGRGR